VDHGLKEIQMQMTRYAAILLTAVSFVSFGQEGKPEAEKLAPYYPTPESVVEKMLVFGGLKAGEKFYDLGSGDGRVVIMAARKFAADATGVELDPDLHKQSTDRIRSLGLESKARIILGDITKQKFERQDPADARKATQEGDADRLPRLHVRRLVARQGRDNRGRRRRPEPHDLSLRDEIVRQEPDP
jgi:SAM-dependent methyltransferase